MWLAVLLLLVPPPTQIDHRTPEGHVAGIVEVPELFGGYACDRFTPEPVAVYPVPSENSAPVGVLETATPWYRTPGGDCESIEVVFRRESGAEPVPVRLMEYGYEAPGLVARDRRGDWSEIELPGGTGWIRHDPACFHAYEDLVWRSLAYLAAGFSGEWSRAPADRAAAPLPALWGRRLASEPVVEVLEWRRVDGELWFHIRLDPEYGCGTEGGDLPASDGWIQGFSGDGAPAIWFYSRGC